MGGMWLIAQLDRMVQIPGTFTSVNVVVLFAGLACLAVFLLIVAVLIVIAASGRRREDET